MDITIIFNKIISMPVHILVKKIFLIVIRRIKNLSKRFKDSHLPTFVEKNVILTQINCMIIGSIQNINLSYITNHYLAHRFDLLGSGWLANYYNVGCLGLAGYSYKSDQAYYHYPEQLLNRANRQESLRIISLIEKGYNPIDWQKDIKSGYRWSEKKWYLDQRVSLPGVDIKVPWELGRLQHLPQLAVFALSDKRRQTQIISEFRNQILDFISMNPPRFGVQWACTMDVGIRVANMLLAYDLLIQIDTDNILDEPFLQIFARSIYEHGLHIVNNLEYNDYLTSNHYLSNLGGLLSVATHLESESSVDQWLAFAVQEIISEMKKQFYKDGSNFEGSTSYHRLSTEIMVYSTAIMLGLNSDKIEVLKNYSSQNWRHRPKLRPHESQGYQIEDNQIVLPRWFVERLFGSGRFIRDITKPTGEIPQIGDNDSGRFFRLSPAGELITVTEAVKKYKNLENYKSEDDSYWDENLLDHRTCLSALSGLFDDKCFSCNYTLEQKIVEYIAAGRKLTAGDKGYKRLKIDSVNHHDFNNLRYYTSKVFSFANATEPLSQGLKLTAYQGIGHYLFKSSRLYLIISAGPNGQNGNGGHAHNDKLSFELNVDGKDVIVDPGTYLYTPFPEERNKFRSTAAHNTIYVEGEEQNEWLPGRNGLFFMKNQSKCYLLDCGENFLDFAVEYRGVRNRRKFIVEDFRLVIESYSNREFTENFNRFNLYSNGYGKLSYEQNN